MVFSSNFRKKSVFLLFIYTPYTSLRVCAYIFWQFLHFLTDPVGQKVASA